MKTKVLEEREILLQIRDLLILQLRSSKVAPETIAGVIGLNTKTIMNRFPSIRKNE